MMSYVYILALIFFSITNGQVTSWTGNGANSTITNSDNWSNGVPTATSIIYINETTCNGCTVTVDEDLVCSELHLGALTGSGPYIQIIGKNLTVTNIFTLGSPSTTGSYETNVDIQGGGVFEIGMGATATIYYTSGGSPITSTIYAEDNWFVNKGTITIIGNGGISAGSYATMYIGNGNGYPLHISNWGNWVVTDGSVQLYFYYCASFDIYGGNFNGVWLTTTGTSTPNLVWYGTDVVLQDGSGGAGTFTGVVYFEAINTQGYSNYASPPPNSLTINTTGVTISNALFQGTNIVFLYDAWIMDSNITDYALINSSSTVSGVHAYLDGSILLDGAVVAGVGTDFIVEVDSDATVTMNNAFAITGSVTLINNGTWIYDSGDYLYFDVQAYWVNTGLMEVITYSDDFISGTLFPGLTTYTDAGTLVNMGTIQFTSGGGINFNSNAGTFLQCKHGILKFGFGVNGGNPGTVTFPSITMDGYIGIYFDSTATVPSTYASLFSFIPETNGDLPSGSFTSLFDTVTVGPGTIPTSQIVCFDPVTGYVVIYSLLDQPTCPTGKNQYLTTIITGDACSGLPDAIMNLQDTAWCPAGANCGLDTGAPAGESNPNSAHSVVAPLAFLVSLVCLLLKF
jgi:hypothetical protein